MSRSAVRVRSSDLFFLQNAEKKNLDAKEASLPAYPSPPYRGTAKTNVRWLHGLLTTLRKSSLTITIE
jgi:hypothetical protein